MFIIMNRKLILLTGLTVFLIISIGVSSFLLKTGITPVVASKRIPVIVIDAGHGGRDPGAVTGRIYEKHINLDVAKRLKVLLHKKGYQVIMTRNSDTNLVNWRDRGSYQRASLWQRAQITRKTRATFLISIHCNSDRNRKYFGPQTFYQAQSVKGRELAVAIQRELSQVNPTRRQAIPGNYYLLNNTAIPTVIIELGYLSNTKDRALLTSSTQRARFAQAIARGINNFLD